MENIKAVTPDGWIYHDEVWRWIKDMRVSPHPWWV